METLMGSCWKIFSLKFGEKDRLIWRPGDASQSRKQNVFPRNQKRDVFLGFSLSVSFHRNTVRSVAPSNQTLIESEETDQLLVADQPKTVHVRFKLTKECAFGQHFVVVGDDPCLGLWDPSDGVRFDWSDGHLWTAELDVPCGKVIKYKFILKLNDNTIHWQPGPDRILETWETEKTIIVFEDWDHPEFQDIAEEESIADLNDEKSLINSELPAVSENSSETKQDEGTNAEKQLVATNVRSSLDEKVKHDSNTNMNYSKHEERGFFDPTEEEERDDLEQEAPVSSVLLPGLIPVLTDETDKESPNEVKDEELKDARNSASLSYTETSKVVMENEKGFHGKEQLEILEGDRRWGRGMVKKFLDILFRL
ncbi:uncharacterized protein [Henckelia pumila]|uniref:uncharacterized protein n=1 Tax=Henckelia pumila TaxID=405737 RepID=UPI003C6DBF19